MRSMARSLPRQVGLNGEWFYRLECDVELLFGLTEHRAQIHWKENVSKLFEVLDVNYLKSSSPASRVKISGVLTSVFQVLFDVLIIKCAGALLKLFTMPNLESDQGFAGVDHEIMRLGKSVILDHIHWVTLR